MQLVKYSYNTVLLNYYFLFNRSIKTVETVLETEDRGSLRLSVGPRSLQTIVFVWPNRGHINGQPINLSWKLIYVDGLFIYQPIKGKRLFVETDAELPRQPFIYCVSLCSVKIQLCMWCKFGILYSFSHMVWITKTQSCKYDNIFCTLILFKIYNKSSRMLHVVICCCSKTLPRL